MKDRKRRLLTEISAEQESQGYTPSGGKTRLPGAAAVRERHRLVEIRMPILSARMLGGTRSPRRPGVKQSHCRNVHLAAALTTQGRGGDSGGRHAGRCFCPETGITEWLRSALNYREPARRTWMAISSTRQRARCTRQRARSTRACDQKTGFCKDPVPARCEMSLVPAEPRLWTSGI